MGGNLTLVSSQEGVGSKFSIMIPILERLKSADEQEDDDYSNSLESSSLDENELSFINNSEEDETIMEEGGLKEEIEMNPVIPNLDRRMPTFTSVFINNTQEEEDCFIVRPGAKLFDNL